MHRLFRSILLICVLTLWPAFAAMAESSSAPRAVTIDDFGLVKAVGDPQLSPDGRQVAYALEGRIYVVPVSGGESRPVTTGASSASEPRWSRDGSVLYFLSDRTGLSQLWKLPLDSFGEAVQVTHL